MSHPDGPSTVKNEHRTVSPSSYGDSQQPNVINGDDAAAQSMDGNGPIVNSPEFINVLQTTFQQMQDRFTQMMDTVMERMDEMSERLNELEKEVTDLVNYAGGIADQPGNKDSENIPPGGTGQP